jgi:c-di-GMP-binding flagellar brake protein YcgR
MTNQHGLRTQRRKLLFYLDIVDQDTYQSLGHLGDISKEGIMIIAEKRIPFENVKRIKIQLPEFEEFTKKYIEAEVEKRWAKPDDNHPNWYRIGCRFIKLNEEDWPTIEQVKEVLGLNTTLSYYS